MKSITRTAAAAVISSVVLLQACATAVVSDENRDTTGLFDGTWKATVLKPAGLQYIGNWNVNCESSEYDIGMIVDQGQVFLGQPGDQNAISTNISTQGKFLFEIPLEDNASTSSSSDVTLANASRILFLRGNLGSKKPTGSHVVGVADLGWQGCYTKVVFEKMSDGIGSIEL